MPEDGLHGRNM